MTNTNFNSLHARKLSFRGLRFEGHPIQDPDQPFSDGEILDEIRKATTLQVQLRCVNLFPDATSLDDLKASYTNAARAANPNEQVHFQQVLKVVLDAYQLKCGVCKMNVKIRYALVLLSSANDDATFIVSGNQYTTQQLIDAISYSGESILSMANVHILADEFVKKVISGAINL